MRYELIISEGQPSCGGKSPTKSTISVVETDDPVLYVKQKEKTEAVEIERNEGGNIRVALMRDRFRIVYDFTED